MKKISFFILVFISIQAFATEYITDRCYTETFCSPDIKHMIVHPSASVTTPQTYYGNNNFRWTYWLGGGNHEVFGTNDSVMYIRARKSNETCDYGYFKSTDSISGGISSLSLLWKQGGVEEGIMYNIAIIINNDTIAKIQKNGLAEYTAAEMLPDTFLLNDINIEGNFILKIENRTQYDGTSNKGRFVFNDLTWCGYDTTTLSANLINGYVRTNTGDPIIDVVVSDGYSVVQTDSNGYYSFERNSKSEFVFLSVPSGYEMPTDETGSPKIYARIQTVEGPINQNFTLTPFADGGKADSTHVLIAISDPQLLNNYDNWRFCNESIKDMQKFKASYPEGTKFYGVVVGDIVWDWYTALDTQKSNCEQLGFPVFMVIGNHDHDCMYKCIATEGPSTAQDTVADHYFKDLFGPTYYSFNRGAIHYVVLDDILYIGCNGNKNYYHTVSQNQVDWLTKDLALVSTGTPIVLCVHAPLVGSNVTNREIIQTLLNKGNVMQHVISGHSHTCNTYEINTRLIDHNIGAVEGAFWAGDICADGSPNGYGVFQAGARGYTDWYYKATGYDRDFQFRAFPINSIDATNNKQNCILANVWNYDSKWTVNIYENGVKKIMRQCSGIDPKAYDFFLAKGDTRPNYPGSDGGTTASKNPGSSSTSHFFYYTPTDSTADFVIEVTDRFGNVYTQPVLKQMMVATFGKVDGKWSYKQDFNALPSYPNQFLSTSKIAKGTFVQGHSPEGWYACTSGTANPVTTTSVTWDTFNYYRIDNGYQSTGWLYLYGEGNQYSAAENDTNRCIGSLVSSDNRCVNFGVLLENNTGKVLSGLDISYVGKMWRAGSNSSAQNQLTFSYALNPDAKALRERTEWIGETVTTNVPTLSFTAPANNSAQQNTTVNAAMNGNLSDNQTVISDTLNVTMAPGDVILLRWRDIDDTGNDQGLGIDDLLINAITAEGSGIGNVAEDTNQMYNVGKMLYFKNIPTDNVYVYNTLGHVLAVLKPTTNTVNLSNLISGVYIVRCGSQTRKIVL